MILSSFISGIFMMGLCVSALVFLRFWKETKDTLFLNFSAAFFLMAIERIPLALFDQMREPHSLVYLFRLAAFLLILWTIFHKNLLTRKINRKGNRRHLRAVE